MFKFLKRKPPTVIVQSHEPKTKPLGIFSTDLLPVPDDITRLSKALQRTFQLSARDLKPVDSQGNQVTTDSKIAMDDFLGYGGLKTGLNYGSPVSTGVIEWYSSQSFMGYQLMAMVAQHWLVDKACRIPARDACRKGFEITASSDIDPKIFDYIHKRDKEMHLRKNLVDYERLGRVFGIRIALPIVESTDPDYLVKPFNPDGVKPGSYKGISQIDPYWATPELNGRSASDPSDIEFYEPTWWRINSQRIHKSHLIIMRNGGSVPDLLKPTYQYGGISIPQKIMERVYAAERSANEVPELLLTKRTMALHVDIEKAILNKGMFDERMQAWIAYRDNYGLKILGEGELLEQIDTSLTDLNEVLMGQYQLVASISDMPVTKLLGTSPKGMDATGEFEEADYHETLESIQEHDLQPLVERHHLLLIRSEVCPKFGVAPFETGITWLPLDSMTAKEQAEMNKIKADTASVLASTGAIDAQDIRDQLINDRDSGFNGLNPAVPVIEDDETSEDDEKE